MQRLKYLDGLKGLGCLMVFITHFKMFGFSHPQEVFSFINEVFFGDMFINVFIAASAYGITSSIYANLQKGGNLRQLILKRYLRLAIPIAFVLLFSAVIHYCGLQWNKEAEALGGNQLLTNYYNKVSISGLVKAIFLSPFGILEGWLSPAWMLKYIFYGTFMTIALVLGTDGLKKSKIYLVCIYFCFLFYFIDPRMIFIILGYMLFVYIQSKKESKYDLWIAILFFLLYFGLRAATYHFHFHRHGNVSYSLALFLIIAVAHSTAIQRFLSTRVMIWLGKISMSVFILHFILLVSVSSWLYIQLYSLPPFAASLINLAITSAILIVMSWGFQKYIEGNVSNMITKKIIKFLEK